MPKSGITKDIAFVSKEMKAFFIEGGVMEQYNPQKIEKKWQDHWEEHGTFEMEKDDSKEKFYALVEFPYPSGDGLHVGHPRPYTGMDIISRKRRLEGYNVLFPMGWDAFGLPAENYAIQNKVHPSIVTHENIKRFKEQLQSIGFSFDWSREVDTTDPEYYKWTQWIFIQLVKEGLAYKEKMPINWCPSCKTGLANEEVVDGGCERCGTEVVQKTKEQWMLKITEYADRLIDDLDLVDFPKRVKAQQINWIGRSYGINIEFQLKDQEDTLIVFTTRPDTIYGVTYMVLAPEHHYIDKYKDQITNYEDLMAYREKVSHLSDLERAELNEEKTGLKIQGLEAVHPITGESIPIFISDYVLITYGSGAVMAVPAHDERDYEFSQVFNAPVKQVIEVEGEEIPVTDDSENTKVINSPLINGLSVPEAQEKIMDYMEQEGFGEKTKNFKLRDWVFSRQRYWGEPIPMIYCEEHGWVTVPEEDLPVKLPDVENYEPTDSGESPLANIESFVNTTCPVCGEPAKRETDTMPQWAGSSWYFIRYIDPNNDEFLANEENIDYFLPVDWYNGGMEHTTLHLLYSRFWYKFLYDIGVVPNKEPYAKRTSHGMILGENNEKMSKSRGNVVNPDDIVHEFGADTLRMYEMFVGDFQSSAPWSEQGVRGCRRFLERVWNAQQYVTDRVDYSEDFEVLMNQSVKKVSEDYENLKFNTAISQLMTVLNEFYDKKEITRKEFEVFLVLLNPVAPHITEELWEILGYGGEVCETKWPVYDEEKLVQNEVEIPIQINGRVRSNLTISADASEDEVLELAKADETIQKYLDGVEIRKVIYIPERILNIVVG